MKPQKLSPRPSTTDLRGTSEDSTSLPRNSTCVDCGAANPTFINNVLAVFVCVLCKKYHLQIFGASGLTAFKESDMRSVKDSTIQQLFAGGNHKSNMHWEASIPPVIAHMKPTRGSLDHEREEWITRKYQQGLFICAAKGFVQLKIEKADPSTVRKSGLKKHVWFQAWGFVKDDKIEFYSDYPPKPAQLILDLTYPGMNIVRAMNPQNMTQLENIALVSGSYNILLKGDAETSSEMWAVAVIGAFQRHMLKLWVDWHGSL